MKSSFLQRPFLDHLDELRGRLIKCLIAVVGGCFVFYPFLDPFLHILIQPVGHLVFTSPTEAFTAYFLLLFWGGFFLSLPVIFYQIWKFVAVALTENEQRYVRILAPFSFLSFVAGIAFGYFVMLPISLKFLLSFSSDWAQPMITVNQYVSFVGKLLLASGLTFELPLILLFLAAIGIATPEFLRQKRRHAIVIIFIVSAILTPPDVFTQLLMAFPLIVLYEMGIFLITWFLKKNSQKKSPSL